jgi:hypothetical protein
LEFPLTYSNIIGSANNLDRIFGIIIRFFVAFMAFGWILSAFESVSYVDFGYLAMDKQKTTSLPAYTHKN